MSQFEFWCINLTDVILGLVPRTHRPASSNVAERGSVAHAKLELGATIRGDMGPRDKPEDICICRLSRCKFVLRHVRLAPSMAASCRTCYESTLLSRVSSPETHFS